MRKHIEDWPGHWFKHLDEVHRLIDLCNKNLKGGTFLEKDVRNTFWGMVSQVLAVYYLGICSMHKANMVLGKRDIPLVGHVKKFDKYLKWDGYNSEFVIQYCGNHRLMLVNGIFMCFESTLDAIYNEIIDEDIRLKHKNRTFQDIKDYIKDLNKEDVLRIEKKLQIRHIPIANKWDAVFKKIVDEYPRDIKKDKEFLRFFAACRNTIHNNTISNIDDEFVTNLGTFVLKKGQPINFMFEDVALAIVEETFQIVGQLSQSIKHEDVIEDKYKIQTRVE